MLRRILRHMAPEEGGQPQPQPETPPAPAPTAPTPAAPEPPLATKIVVEGTKTEREIELERRLEQEAEARRKAETDASYHADEARRLKELQSQRPSPPAKKKRVTKLGTGWFPYETEED